MQLEREKSQSYLDRIKQWQMDIEGCNAGQKFIIPRIWIQKFRNFGLMKLDSLRKATTQELY